MLYSVTRYIQCYVDVINRIMTQKCFVNANNQCSIVVTGTHVLGHATSTGLYTSHVPRGTQRKVFRDPIKGAKNT